ncbi:MAG: site-specific tyrosine recombinase XerD [Leptonema illini]|uniref:Tyrosine recombinase XerD n=2 Tax=Leptonema illini TaxID=183 RepID=H2CC15_9LEPT|nr:site-specific tyrosine recombinase XerD [Leptonema illini]EHQ08687.1 tyrosine recombinase XerD subunit [Leptonema illini DSM 21528]KAB2934072.1 MAG: site-specific tyrosine recombinase XerD [Leptonema illini]
MATKKKAQQRGSTDLIKEFQDYLLVERGLSENSIFAYSYDIKKFLDYLQKFQKGKAVGVVTSDDIVAFLKQQQEMNISTRSRARELAALRQFFGYLRDEGRVKVNPADKVEPPEIRRTLPDYLTVDEIRSLFTVFDENDPYEIRDRAIFEMMYSSGLRISEACAMKMSDVDLDNLMIAVRGKGGRERLIPFGEQSKQVIDDYLTNSREVILKDRDSEYLFISKKGESLNRKSVWRLLKKYISRTGITKTVTPHTFRHSFATHLIENNADLRSVQELLGHLDIATTQIYTHMAASQLKEVHRKHHPRG